VGTRGSDKDRVRIDLLLERLRYARFAHILDLGCGEGHQTAALSQLAGSTLGIDIAENALERARSQFPNIRFQQGELLDVIKDPEILQIPFDLISVSEVLYYFQTDEERRAALAGLAQIGVPACIYYFSVIVTGASKYRRYFTHQEFLTMLSQHFQVIDCFASVADLPGIPEGAASSLAVEKNEIRSAQAMDGQPPTRGVPPCRIFRSKADRTMACAA
jgi:SAM-dependent methyltransferase